MVARTGRRGEDVNIRRVLPGVLVVLMQGVCLRDAWPGVAGGNSIFVMPPDPHTRDAIAISYPRRGCGREVIDTSTRGKDIEITVSFEQTCLQAVSPGVPLDGLPQAAGALYGRVELGHLPAGNYRVTLYYRDLSEGRRSRSFVATELFAVMPSR